ncbi:MAG: class I SAM-dependent methyltransferase [Hellea sp.]|nr:class I SAM-dependent methyltransferase [Hellea sp.]
METESEAYSEYLEEKYLPGRDLYLNRLFYPRILKELGEGPIVDLGFGAGAFLKFARKKSRNISGIDSNPAFVDTALSQGFDVALDDITKLATVSQIENAVCDNVLEHLTAEQLEAVFSVVKDKLATNGKFVAIVPDKQGYKKDPTHRTFIDPGFLEPLCQRHELQIGKTFCYPFNSRTAGKYFYLNMQIFVITHMKAT